jgi:hypothetical protein
MPDEHTPVVKTATYRAGKGPVYLSVSVGRKQHGSVLVDRPGLSPVSGSTDLVGLYLGDGQDLIGKLVSVYTTVTYIDQQAAKGALVVDYTLTGNGAPPDCDQSTPVPALNHATQFVLDISFEERR